VDKEGSVSHAVMELLEAESFREFLLECALPV
jgi:hypothetical protein